MTVSLHIKAREERGHGIDKVRQEGGLPGVVYGPKQEAIAVTLDKREFDKVFKEAGESTIISLEGLEEPIEVLVQEVDFAPTKGGIQHVDFYAIERGKKMTTTVPIEFIGESPVEKQGGVVNRILHEVEVTCKPSDLPHSIEVDLSELAEFEARISIADLKLPSGVEIEHEPDELVVIVAEAEEEPEEEGGEVDMDAVEVEQKGKEEEGGEDEEK